MSGHYQDEPPIPWPVFWWLIIGLFCVIAVSQSCEREKMKAAPPKGAQHE